MILIDTGPLVGLINPRDERHARARADLPVLAKRPMAITVPVLTETLFFLRPAIARRKLQGFLDDFDIALIDTPQPTIEVAIEWMLKYASHTPDFADAVSVVLSAEMRGLEIWTYDSEFWKIWRRPDGSSVPMAVKGP